MILNSLELLTENPATLFVGGSVFAINEHRDDIEEELEKRLKFYSTEKSVQLNIGMEKVNFHVSNNRNFGASK